MGLGCICVLCGVMSATRMRAGPNATPEVSIARQRTPHRSQSLSAHSRCSGQYMGQCMLLEGCTEG